MGNGGGGHLGTQADLKLCCQHQDRGGDGDSEEVSSVRTSETVFTSDVSGWGGDSEPRLWRIPAVG